MGQQAQAIAAYDQWLEQNAAALAAGDLEFERRNFRNWVRTAELAYPAVLRSRLDFLAHVADKRISPLNTPYINSRIHYREYIVATCSRRGIHIDVVDPFANEPY